MKVAILIPRIHRNQTTRLLIKTINLIEALRPVLLTNFTCAVHRSLFNLFLNFVGGVGLEPTCPLGSGFTGRRANQIAQSTQNFRWFTRVPTSQWATTFALQGYLLLRFQMLAHCHINCFGSVLFLAWFQHSYKFIGHAGFGPAEPPDPKSGALPGWANVRWKSYLNGFRQILNYLRSIIFLWLHYLQGDLNPPCPRD